MLHKPPNDGELLLNDNISSLSQNDMEALKDKLMQGFQDWTEKLQQNPLDLEGRLILCDPFGIKLASYSLHPSSYLSDIDRIADWKSAEAGFSAVHLCISHKSIEQVRRIEHPNPELRSFHSIAGPIISNGTDITGIIVLLYNNGDDAPDSRIMAWFASGVNALQSYMCLEQEKIRNARLSMIREYYETELKKRDVLFQMANKLHANMDVDSVLSDIIHSMKEIYPGAHIELYLAQDSHSNLLTVKPLLFKSEEDGIHIKAYVEGRPVFDTAEDNGETVRCLAVPLCGQQGVYGVLHVAAIAPLSTNLDVDFITQLADSAGTAFENARLHESSNVLINELRLINEITRRLNQSLKLHEVFQFASDELIKIFKADFGLILQTDNENELMVVQSSNLSEMARDTFALDYGFAGIMLNTKEPIIISDYSLNPKVRSKLMESTGARSMIGSPIIVGSDVVGVIMIAHRLPHYFSYDNFKLLQVLSGHIGLAITNASLHAEVRRMVVTDNLTGLYARHYLDEQINLMQKKDFCGSLILADIDLFKSINDTYGHQIGDKALRQVSEIIKSSIRDTDIAARWGGEELAVYLPQLTVEQTIRIAERIRVRIEKETDPQVTVSCGISQWSWEDDKISVETLFYKADMALYEAKREGRNRIMIG